MYHSVLLKLENIVVCFSLNVFSLQLICNSRSCIVYCILAFGQVTHGISINSNNCCRLHLSFKPVAATITGAQCFPTSCNIKLSTFTMPFI